MNACRNCCGQEGMSGNREIFIKQQENGKVPIAMAYVPWQKWREILPPDQGLAEGTIFKELDQPFSGKRGCR